MAKNKNDLQQYQVRKTKGWVNVLISIFLAIWAIINLYPLYWMFTFALKDNKQILDTNKFGLPEGAPNKWFWSNFKEAMNTGPIGRFFLNSIIITFATIVITTLAAMMASYAITRIRWRASEMMNRIFMLGITIPIQASIIPVYLVVSKLKLINTPIALIVPYSAFSLAMALLICNGFMIQIPKELDEAAYIDGCGRGKVFFSVILPLMKPAVATTAIYTFLQCWNELMFASTFLTGEDYMTLPAGMAQLFGSHTTEWGPIGAALVIATMPTIVFYILFSRRIQDSFIAGAVKG
ncbi:MAG: carbohydrate ABC transporter permease [Lachnospiraceae bacterium]|nr:carbohydrate ABC transporter permease [Lachnospiraceae bacterium]